MDFPRATRSDVVETLHGHRIPDPYRWLEDADDPATKEWSAAQDTLFVEQREGWPARERFAARLGELMGSGSVGPPVWRGERRFSTRREPGQEHAVLYVTEGGTERVLIDPMALDPTGTTTLDRWVPSVEGDRLAYLLSSGGTEESSVYVLDVATGEAVEGPIDRARHTSIAWLPGGAEFYYQRHEPGEEGIHHRRIYRHRVGEDPAGDLLVHGAGAERATYHSASVSRDGRWLLITSSRGTDPRNELWIADLHAAEPHAFTAVLSGLDAQASGVVRDDRLYVWTDLDAPRGRICTAAATSPGHTQWATLIPEDPEAVISDWAFVDGPGLLAVAHTRHAVSEVSVHEAATGARVSTVELPGLGTVTDVRGRPVGGDELWIAFDSYAAPQRILQWTAGTGEVSVYAVPPGQVDPPPVEVRQEVYRSLDGTDVRMFVLSSPGTDGPRPTVLYGYGGFDISLVPQYWPLALAWIEAGGVYAVANLRGGGEEGQEWHRAGMRAHKQNVFDDFHSAADHLVATGVASTVGCYGGSNGGLLVGAAVTQRPDRFDAVVCSAPLLDMVRYERFGLGPNWSGEYGTAEDPEELGWLLGYSPYHRVREGTAYPATLFTVFEGDTRVDTMHARKLAAAMQHATAGDAPILVRREVGVGHSSRAVSRTIGLNADVLAFLSVHLGLSG
ncbi:prolyl endopeptidase [Virgisporangium aliadipatigenens]|uniref:prolyl oligopeptidase n=1 Tax=Virgisporangium aliadipatigenens TaxID=741659 RepID=A0A8J3YUT1_9ACTN|nr:prolyl oligopeptidase family serine peptidase [Virgisporangium aliadipatigenens]GIJ50196.1 prolyl endopeptidase [Virgisporangium aliadipatigenens]